MKRASHHRKTRAKVSSSAAPIPDRNPTRGPGDTSGQFNARVTAALRQSPVVNALLAKPKAASINPAQAYAAHRAFLPAAIELVETPVSPISTAMIWFFAILAASLIGWSCIGEIDVHAVAQGRVAPSGRSKIVQPLEPGRITVVHVANGQHVDADEILVELDPTDSGADRNALTQDVMSLEAEVARRTAAISVAEHADPEATVEPVATIAFASDVDAPTRRSETEVLQADLSQLRSSSAELRAQIDQSLAQKRRLSDTIKTRERLISLLRERVSMRQHLVDRAAGSRANVIDSEQSLEQVLTLDASERGQLAEMDAAVVANERKIAQATSDFIAGQAQKRADAEHRLSRARQDLVKAIAKSEHTRLRAPIAGTVQQLSVSTIGQVVSAGQAVMTIVPDVGPLIVEAVILNQDIGFVHKGQSAVVKIDAFPFTHYGTISGLVTTVSRDAVDIKDPSGSSDVSIATRPMAATITGTQQTSAQNLVFPIVIELQATALSLDGEKLPLRPGMGVTVEVQTGRRRLIDYVLSPLREVGTTAGHER